MLLDMLSKKGRIIFENKPIAWEDAISKSASGLLNEKKIEQSYIEKMIENVNVLGPYIVIAPDLALAHARPEDGVNKVGLSLLITEKPVTFPKEKQVRLIFTLAAPDDKGHLELLSELAQIFSVQDNIETLSNLTTEQEVLKFLKKSLGGN